MARGRRQSMTSAGRPASAWPMPRRSARCLPPWTTPWSGRSTPAGPRRRRDITPEAMQLEVQRAFTPQAAQGAQERRERQELNPAPSPAAPGARPAVRQSALRPGGGGGHPASAAGRQPLPAPRPPGCRRRQFSSPLLGKVYTPACWQQPAGPVSPQRLPPWRGSLTPRGDEPSHRRAAAAGIPGQRRSRPWRITYAVIQEAKRRNAQRRGGMDPLAGRQREIQREKGLWRKASNDVKKLYRSRS